MSQHDDEGKNGINSSNQTDTLLESHHKIRAGFFHRWFGCCLDRAAMSRRVSSYSENNDDNQNQEQAYEPPHRALSSPLRFNTSARSKPQINQPKGIDREVMIAQNPINDKKKQARYEEINQITDDEDDGSYEAGPEARSSSTQKQTHNYSFDASNYVSDRVSLSGNLMQIMVLVTDKHFNLDLSVNTQENQLSQNSSVPLLQRKLFHRRTLFFHDYDQGIRVHPQSWEELIYEDVLQHVAKRGAISPRREFVIDAFCCGSGQLTVNLSRYFSTVISIQPDTQKLAASAHNAQHYRIANNLYQRTNRLSLNEGILFFKESEFLDDKFATASNLSDIVFLSLINFSRSRQIKDYFSKSQEFIEDLKDILKKALVLAPQVILITPRNTKISSVCEAFTDAIKDNLNTVMRCSIEVEKEMINGHLKYLVFYFGEFNCEKLSPAEEIKYINNLLGKCQSQSSSNIKLLAQQEKQPQAIHIHSQIFQEIGRFQLLNIVQRFADNLKLHETSQRVFGQISKPTSSHEINQGSQQASILLNRFYGYLIDHGFVTQAKVDLILSMNQQQQQLQNGEEQSDRTLSSVSYGSTVSGNTTANIQDKINGMRMNGKEKGNSCKNDGENARLKKGNKQSMESDANQSNDIIYQYHQEQENGDNNNNPNNSSTNNNFNNNKTNISISQEIKSLQDSTPINKQPSQQHESMEKREFGSGEDEIVQSRLFSGMTESGSDYEDEEEEEEQEDQYDNSSVLPDSTNPKNGNTSNISGNRTELDIANYRKTQQVYFTKKASNISNVSKSDDLSNIQQSQHSRNIVFKQDYFNSQKHIEGNGNEQEEMNQNNNVDQGNNSRTSSESTFARFSVKSKSEMAEQPFVQGFVNNNRQDNSQYCIKEEEAEDISNEKKE